MPRSLSRLGRYFSSFKAGITILKNGMDICVLYNYLVINKKMVMARLATVMDPELHIDIVSLGLIYSVTVSQSHSVTVSQCHIKVVMTLTTPGCPLAPVIDRMVKEAVSELEGIEEENVIVNLEWDPPWTKDMMSEEARLKLGMMG